MDRNDELNDRMTDSNSLSGTGRRDTLGTSAGLSAATDDPTLEGTSRARALTDDDDRRGGDTPGDEIGEAVGGISGVLTGAALGSLGGPIGTVIGGIAGAVSGWWAGRAISEAASHVTNDDDSYYRTQYESSTARPADRSYDDVRPAYQIGHLAGRNPDYQGRSFDEIEGDLRQGWSSDVSARHGDWDQVRNYAREGYGRGQSTYNTGALGGAAATAAGTAGYAAGRVADGVDDMKDRVDGNPASRPGPDATDRSGYGTSSGMSGGTLDRAGDRMENAADNAWDSTKRGADRLGDKVENAWDRTKAGAENLADRAGQKLDNVKDRVDGDPASRPGPDATDRKQY